MLDFLTCSQSPVVGSASNSPSSFVASIDKIFHCFVKIRDRIDPSRIEIFHTRCPAKSRNMDLHFSIVVVGVGACVVSQSVE